MPSRLWYAALRHDQAVVLAGLASVVVIAWLYLLHGAGIGMQTIENRRAPDDGHGAGLDPAYAALIFVMWAVMMAAMMLPSAAPTILLVSALARNGVASGSGAPSAAGFALGYISVWVGFSLAATLLQWALSRLGLLLPQGMLIGNGMIAGAILVAAGIYQWTPLKRACLAHCRSPLDFLMRYWRKGTRQALACGARHGAFCLGCCWMLMALLFIGGLMNLLWIAALALLVLIEKTLPWGVWSSRLAGVALVGWGILTIASAAHP